MYCPKCKYTSFDHLEQCPKCGRDWEAERKALNLDWLVPSHWRPPQASGRGGGGNGGLSFGPAEAAQQSSQQQPMQTSEFLDLADTGDEDTAEFVYDLSEEPESHGGERPEAAPSALEDAGATADDEIVLDFDSYEVEAGPETAGGAPDTESPAGAGEEDAFADLQLDEEQAVAEEPAGRSGSPETVQGEGGQRDEELTDILEDEELELDDILIELDAEDERSQGKS